MRALTGDRPKRVSPTCGRDWPRCLSWSDRTPVHIRDKGGDGGGGVCTREVHSLARHRHIAQTDETGGGGAWDNGKSHHRRGHIDLDRGELGTIRPSVRTADATCNIIHGDSSSSPGSPSQKFHFCPRLVASFDQEFMAQSLAIPKPIAITCSRASASGEVVRAGEVTQGRRGVVEAAASRLTGSGVSASRTPLLAVLMMEV